MKEISNKTTQKWLVALSVGLALFVLFLDAASYRTGRSSILSFLWKRVIPLSSPSPVTPLPPSIKIPPKLLSALQASGAFRHVQNQKVFGEISLKGDTVLSMARLRNKLFENGWWLSLWPPQVRLYRLSTGFLSKIDSKEEPDPLRYFPSDTELTLFGEMAIQIHSPLEPLPRVAIVIDDCGFGGRLSDSFLTLPYPITYAVLPFRPRSRRFSKKAFRAGYQVMLHLPMEPFGYPKRANPGAGALFRNMTEEEIRAQAIADWKAIPYALGFNNHMGSAFTSDSHGLETLFQALAPWGAFFIDSHTSGKTVARSLARKHGFPTGINEVFLDNDRTVEDVKKRLEVAFRKAEKGKEVIAIGHIQSLPTYLALKEILPSWKGKISLVFAAQLMR